MYIVNTYKRLFEASIRYMNRSKTQILIEWLVIFWVAYFLCFVELLDFNPNYLQQNGEQNESATRPLLAEIGLKRYGEIPLWNHYMQTGFPQAGDLLGHFWSPIATIPVWIWGGIVGMKISVFLSFMLAGFGQWYLAQTMGIKGIFRLWAALMFMLSGGLALLWHLGWYELLVGMAWFPWVFASFWQALHKKTISSLIWTAICLGMVLTTGGGYYPIYLLVCAIIILGVAIGFASAQQKKQMFKRSFWIALLGLGLIAVYVFPLYQGFQLITREVGPDLEQFGSQPVHYALINYLVSAGEWFHATILGTSGGWNWFYIGPLSLGSLIFLPFALRRWRPRSGLWAMTILFCALILWHANRYTPVKYIYDWLPFLYNLRFPNRLLILAASPLLILSGASLQTAFYLLRKKLRTIRITITTQKKTFIVSGGWVAILLAFALLFTSFRNVYATNQSFAMPPSAQLEPKAYTALRWLKTYDPSLYYTSVGTFAIFWSWTSVAYDLEMPVYNFVYSQRLKTQDQQNSPEAPFSAQPKYTFWRTDEPLPKDATLLREFDGINLWYFPDALPFAFWVPTETLQTSAKITKNDVQAAEVIYDGPNRVLVSGSPPAENQQLVVLVSNYPGWKLHIDGQPAKLSPVNDYLGATTVPGTHTYTFIFAPVAYFLGLAVSIFTIILMIFLFIREKVFSKKDQDKIQPEDSPALSNSPSPNP